MTVYNKENPIQIMIVDDHKILAESLSKILKEEEDMEVVNISHSAKEAIRFLKADNVVVHLVILDLQMEENTESHEPSGFKVARYIIDDVFVKDFKEVRILIMSQHREGHFVALAHKIGVHGYLPKDCESKELFDAVRWIVGKKRRYYRGKIEEAWDNFSEQSVGTQTPKLTRTEFEILQLIAAGRTSQEIADMRNRGIDGVEAHRRNIMRKLDANNAPHLISLAHKWGLIK